MSKQLRAKEFSRQALYDLVWSQPMRTLAAEFGLSDVAIAKTCRKHGIPVPPRGYWAKRAAGEKATKVALPPRDLGMPDVLTVGSGGYQQQLSQDELLGPLPPRPEFPNDLDEIRAAVDKKIGRVGVPTTLKRVHPAIGKLLAEDDRRRAKQSASRYPSFWDGPIFDAPPERRRLRILNSLFLAVSRVGAKPEVRGRKALEVWIGVGEQSVPIMLDGVRKGRRPDIRYERKRPVDLSKLQFDILEAHYGGHVRMSWADDADGKVESKLASIAVEIVVWGERTYRENKIRSHEWRVERQQQLEDEARARRLESERAVIQEREEEEEKARRERLQGLARDLRQANDIRALVQQVKRASRVSERRYSNDDLDRWEQWALGVADRLDPVHSGAVVESIDDLDDKR